jgi:hypothetical protein
MKRYFFAVMFVVVAVAVEAAGVDLRFPPDTPRQRAVEVIAEAYGLGDVIFETRLSGTTGPAVRDFTDVPPLAAISEIIGNDAVAMIVSGQLRIRQASQPPRSTVPTTPAPPLVEVPARPAPPPPAQYQQYQYGYPYDQAQNPVWYGRVPQPRLPFGHPLFPEQPSVKCGATWFEQASPGQGVHGPGWYLYNGVYWRPLQFGDCGEYRRPAQAYQTGVGGGIGYGYQSSYPHASIGWYGYPIFDFQVEEFRMKYQDVRRLAKVKFKGGKGCGSDCLRQIHVLVIIDGKEHYLAGTATHNNWWNRDILVPIDPDTQTAQLWFVREQAGTMRGVERNMWLPSQGQRRGSMPLPIDHSMFANARELRVLNQKIQVEVGPGQFEDRTNYPAPKKEEYR